MKQYFISVLITLTIAIGFFAVNTAQASTVLSQQLTRNAIIGDLFTFPFTADIGANNTFPESIMVSPVHSSDRAIARTGLKLSLFDTSSQSVLYRVTSIFAEHNGASPPVYYPDRISTGITIAITVHCCSNQSAMLAVDTQTHSLEGLQGVTATHTSNVISYRMNAGYTVGDRIFFTFPTDSMISFTFPNSINLPVTNSSDPAIAAPGIVMEKLSTTNNRVTYRVTGLTTPHNNASPPVFYDGKTTVGTTITLGAVNYLPAALPLNFNHLTYTISSCPFIAGGEIPYTFDTLGTHTARVAEARSQFGAATVTREWDAIIDASTSANLFTPNAPDTFSWTVNNPDTTGWHNLATINSTTVELVGTAGNLVALNNADFTAAGAISVDSLASKVTVSYTGAANSDTVTFTAPGDVALKPVIFTTNFSYNYTSIGGTSFTNSVGINVNSGGWQSVSDSKVSLIASPLAIAESLGNAMVTAFMNDVATEDVTVELGFSGTATNGHDYYPPFSTITIPAGQTRASTVLESIGDNLVEAEETIIVDIISVSGGVASENGVQQQIVTINDNDNASVTLTASTTSLAEAGATSTLTATLDKPSFENMTVNLGYSGTATNGTDYATGPASITILAGQTSGSATLTVIQDTLFEPAETITVDITSVTGGRGVESGTQQQTLTITDDDITSVSLSLSAATMGETGGTSTLTATLTQASFDTTVVNLGYSGTANSGTDYATGPANITITAGQTTATTVLRATNDTVLEGDETIIVDITSVTGERAVEGSIGQQTLTIVDDETTTATLTATVDTILEGEQTTSITVTLSQPTFEDVAVNLGFSGTASQGIDYATNAETITIAKGETTASTTIIAKQDTILEENETIIVGINSISGGNAVNTSQQQIITIIDNSTIYVTLTTASSAIDEASGNTTVTANLNHLSINDVTVGLRYSGSATAELDYSADTDSITIAAGQISSSATLNVIQDNIVEADEVIIVAVTEVTGGHSFEKGIQQQNIKILDDDIVSVNLSVSSAVIDEAAGFNFITATLDNPAAANVTVNLGYSGTATEGNDYERPPKAITIVPGEITQSAALTARDDTTNEGSETVRIDITGTSGVNVDASGATSQSVTITDDDEVGPAGYDVTIDVDFISSQNHLAFTINHAAIGDTYHYTVSDNDNADIKGTGEVTLATQPVDNIDVATLADGRITLTVALTDPAGNVGSPTRASIMKETSAPIVELLRPRNNATAVMVKPTLTLEFDEIIHGGVSENQITVKSLATNDVITSLGTDSEAVMITGNHVDISLPQDLPHSTDYYVTIGTGAFVDRFGNTFGGLSDNTLWRFSTANPNLMAANDRAQTSEDNQVNIAVLNNDVSLDSSLNPASMMLKQNPLRGSAKINTANGVITYQPEPNFNGSDRFSYKVMDLLGNTSTEVTVDVNISRVNDAPQAQNDTSVVTVNGSVVIDVVANDIDVDTKSDIDVTSLLVVQLPTHGQTTVSEGKINYMPDTGYQGSDHFTYAVSDKSGAVSNIASVSVNVAGSNEPPATTDDVLSTDEDEAVSISVLGNDQDIDGQLVVDSVVIVNGPHNGTVQVQADGSIIYTPALNTTGQDQFSYTVKDNGDAVSRATPVTVNVTPINDAPVANDDIAVIIDSAPHSINVKANDHDIDSYVTNLTLLSQPERGTVTMNNHQQIVFTPDGNFSGTDSFTYQLTDDVNALSNVATVELTVATINSAPLTNNDWAQTGQNTAVTINVLSNDSDIDGSLNQASVVIVSEPTSGTVTVQSNGDITYTPAQDFIGQDEWIYQVSDDQGALSSATVSIRVNAVGQ